MLEGPMLEGPMLEVPMLKTLDCIIRIGSTPTFLYYLFLYIVAHLHTSSDARTERKHFTKNGLAFTNFEN